MRAARPKSKPVATPISTTDASAKLPRFVELVRVSGAAQVKKDTPESQRQTLDRLRAQRPGLLVERIEALAVSAAIPLHQTESGRRLIQLAQSKAFDELRASQTPIDRSAGAQTVQVIAWPFTTCCSMLARSSWTPLGT